ncbi:CLUMA_CG016068, isoform A [Clunio marinus]|uniref:CLUMA_CG016068, isoform A n=1 Tax=Clunio marinus TaxID=568069 RepID=A0A1J1IRH6_9DIPT|nr:CLUMA_CG016068, isoform A [Clunio marinus]
MYLGAMHLAKIMLLSDDVLFLSSHLNFCLFFTVDFHIVCFSTCAYDMDICLYFDLMFSLNDVLLTKNKHMFSNLMSKLMVLDTYENLL